MNVTERWVIGVLIIVIMSLFGAGYAKVDGNYNVVTEKINMINVKQAETNIQYKHIIEKLKEIKLEVKKGKIRQ